MKIKNVFKKNQIIIFALALMIAIAGYLNFSRDKAGEKKAEEAASSAVGDELFTQVDGESYTDISDEDDALLTADLQKGNLLEVNDPVSTDGTVVSNKDTAGEEVAANPDKSSEVAAETGKEEVAAEAGKENVAAEPGKEEVAANTENAAPGEAILASTQIDSSYFSTAKLTREQTRARNKEALMGIIQDANVAQEQKDEAIDTLVELTAIAEKENATEILLEAKGFSGVVVSIVEDSVDVIVNATSLTEQDMAIIEDVVMRKTGLDAEHIAITNVVTQE